MSVKALKPVERYRVDVDLRIPDGAVHRNARTQCCVRGDGRRGGGPKAASARRYLHAHVARDVHGLGIRLRGEHCTDRIVLHRTGRKGEVFGRSLSRLRHV